MHGNLPMKYAFVTAGEQLAYFIDRNILVSTPWSKVAESLLYTGRSEVLCDFFREITVLNLAGRIVTSGTSLLKESINRPTRKQSDTSFVTKFSDFIRERFYMRPPIG